MLSKVQCSISTLLTAWWHSLLLFVHWQLHIFLCCESASTQETWNGKKTSLLSKKISCIVAFVSKNSLTWFELIQYPIMLYSESITANA